MTSPSRASRFAEAFSGGPDRAYASEAEFIGGVGVVAVSGDTDLFTANRFKRDIDEARELSSGDVILDLSDLDTWPGAVPPPWRRREWSGWSGGWPPGHKPCRLCRPSAGSQFPRP